MGLRLPQPPLRPKPHPFQLLPNLPFAELDAHNSCKSRTGGNPTVITAFGYAWDLLYYYLRKGDRVAMERMCNSDSSAAKPCRSGERQGEGPLTSTLKLPPSFFRT